MIVETSLTAAQARRILGVGRLAGREALRRAFREHAKRTHPDRPGGDAAAFRDGLEAFRRLQDGAADGPPQTLASPEPAAEKPGGLRLVITVAQAMAGGAVDLPIGERTLRVRLPAGLRAGDRLRVEERLYEIAVAAEPDACVRGGDLWLTVEAAGGGRLAVETPLGRRIVWIDRRALERGLLRVPGAGLPARGAHTSGALYLRLRRPEAAETPLRLMLRRFADAWAA